jgi:hypothetical protein
MAESLVKYDTVYTMALKLSRADRARLIAQIAPTLVEETAQLPKQSSYGALADLRLDVSNEDIDEVRRDMLAGFPREDITE